MDGLIVGEAAGMSLERNFSTFFFAFVFDWHLDSCQKVDDDKQQMMMMMMMHLKTTNPHKD